MSKLLQLFTNTLVAIALAFLLAGTPAGTRCARAAKLPGGARNTAADGDADAGQLRRRWWLPSQMCRYGGNFWVVIACVNAVVGVTISVDWLWPLTNAADETLFDQLHDWLWSRRRR